MSMPWLPSLNTGIVGFDDDHRHLFEVLAEMRGSLRAGNLSGVRALFEVLRDATLEHFHEEEALMDHIAYPAAATHRQEHDRCRAALRQLQVQLDGGRSDRFADALAEYSADYFRGVLRCDGALARFLRQGGVISPPADPGVAAPGGQALPA